MRSHPGASRREREERHVTSIIEGGKACVALLILTLAVSVGCGEDDSGVGPDDCDFSGITVTNETGEILESDADDWCQTSCVPVPSAHGLLPASPNPFGIQTSITYCLPVKKHVRIALVSTGCDTVKTLVDDVKQAGVYDLIWDGTDREGIRVAGGIYRCVMLADGFECHGDVQLEGQ
jgi:hypothetical protein